MRVGFDPVHFPRNDTLNELHGMREMSCTCDSPIGRLRLEIKSHQGRVSHFQDLPAESPGSFGVCPLCVFRENVARPC